MGKLPFLQKNESTGAQRTLVAVCMFLMIFQHALEKVWGPFSVIDELIALCGICWLFRKLVFQRPFDLPAYMLAAVACFAVFAAAGLAGNVIYRYQPWKSVLIDVYTNAKFFFAIAAGYGVCQFFGWDSMQKEAVRWGRVFAVAVFAVFLVDRVYPMYSGAIRYGFRTATLFFGHPTYLAGAMAFLLMLFVTFYEKKNLPFMGMCLVVLVFTLRSKAFASAAVYVAVFVFFVVFRKRVKLWHVLLAGIVCVVVAWPQISYYFIELGGKSTRSVMHSVAFQIMGDYFPIGTGFGTYASAEAAKSFSPVYEIYNFEYLLRFEKNRQWVGFLNDTFWPIIIGQTGAIGTAAYLGALGSVFLKSWKLQQKHLCGFAAVLYAWCHLLICSIAEPAFNNSTAIPLALVMGIVLCNAEKIPLKETNNG